MVGACGVTSFFLRPCGSATQSSLVTRHRGVRLQYSTDKVVGSSVGGMVFVVVLLCVYYYYLLLPPSRAANGAVSERHSKSLIRATV